MRHCVCIILFDHQHPQLVTADAELMVFEVLSFTWVTGYRILRCLLMILSYTAN